MSKWGITPSSLRATSVPALGGDTALVAVPDNYEATRGTGLVLWLHGSGHDHTNPYARDAERVVSDELLANGLIIASPRGHSPTHWGNTQAITDANALYDHVIANWNITNTIILGESMGGLHGLLVFANGHVPAIGWYGVSPACDLANMYASGFASLIRTAYGMAADGSDYASKSAGHDPMLLAQSTWTGKKLRFAASPADGAVTKTNNTDAMITRTTGYATENSLLLGSGGHLSADQFVPSDFLAFRDRCL